VTANHPQERGHSHGTLHIDGLHCVKQRDPVGKDEIDIYVTIDSGSEIFLSGPHFLDTSNNDDFVDLHQDRTFTGVIKVRLKERNGDRGGNNDKDLGLKVFQNTELTDGGESTFGTDGVSYKLDYRITA
jgi:hypothetical protein